MKKALLTLTIFLVSYSVVLAQEERVSGTVTGSDGSGIPGITVQIKGTNTGTATDAGGHYQISVSGNAALIFRGIGYEQQELAVDGRTTINVVMFSSTSKLNELVVVGYGTSQKLGSVVGSVATVSSDVTEAKPVANVLDALQGQVAGLQVLTSSGEPSASSSIRIHGVGSLGAGSTPLFVLDGIPVSKGTILSLNPNDFASITVLKDASATAIYGSRAANGVIYITTKQGQLNGEDVITITAQTGYSAFTSNTTDQFDRMMNTKQLTDFWVDAGLLSRGDVDNLLSVYTGDTRWDKYILRHHPATNKMNVSFRGGEGKTTYFVSGSYMNQEGVAYNSMYKRYTLRTNISSRLNPWLKFGFNVGLGYDRRNTNSYWDYSAWYQGGGAVSIAPFYSPYDSTGKPYPKKIPGTQIYNPAYRSSMLPNNNNNLQVNPTGYIELTPIEGLTIKSQAGIDWYDWRASSKRLPSFVGSLDDGSASEDFEREITRTITNTIEYKFNLSNVHNFTILVGQEHIGDVYTSFNASSKHQTDDRLLLLQNGSDYDVGSSKSNYVFSSWFGRVDYNYLEKYYLTATIRNDGSSRFGERHRYATFGSIGGMWKVSDERFMQNINQISDLSLRVSYGTSGNSDIGNYNSLGLVSTTQYRSEDGWYLGSPGNDDLTWEQQSQLNIGLQFDLLDKAHFNVEFYNRLTSNMLIDVPFPYTSGFATITQNTGTLKNSGVDIHITADVYKTKDAYISPYINLNYNKDKVTALFQGKDHWIIPNTSVAWVVGKPVMFYMPIWAGVNPSNGHPQWYVPKAGHSETVHKDPDDVTDNFVEADLTQNTGVKRYAPWSGGFGLNAGYKGFYLQADFSFIAGKHLFNNDRYFFENPIAFFGDNASKRVLNYWKQPGDHAMFPSTAYQVWTQFDSKLLENASFLRLKNIVIGYKFSKKLLAHTGFLSGAKIFLTGRNLLTFTKYLGANPEVDGNLVYGLYPDTEQLMAGIQLQF